MGPQIAWIKKIISEDALGRSLLRMSAEQSQAWLAPQLMGSVQAALDTRWILEINTTIKPLYSKQSAAEVSYNSHKPGRPSHALHTYWVGNLRLVLDVVVLPGKGSTVRPRLERSQRQHAGQMTLYLTPMQKDVPGLRCGDNHPPAAAVASDRPAHSGGVTAGLG